MIYHSNVHNADNLMIPQHMEVYQKIQTLLLDQPDVQLSFSQRLARDNNWSLCYTQRVIEEYKKFIFLAVVARHPVVPSDSVDQVWHLHLTYTHSYWDELCNQILQKPLHHHPTLGGASQRQLFWNAYRNTLSSYEKFFGQRPPSDIWAPLGLQFSQTTQFRRIDTQAYWLIPKPSFSLPQLKCFRVFRLDWIEGNDARFTSASVIPDNQYFLINRPLA